MQNENDMKKAIIRLIEAKILLIKSKIKSNEYRCNHSWIHLESIGVYKNPNDELPHTKKTSFRCTKCCEFKTHVI